MRRRASGRQATFRRVGGTRDLTVDTRLITATNRDLQADVDAGTFRADLFYRLRVVPLYLPPLRERASDIPELAKHFIDSYSRDLGKRVRRIAPDALELLRQYPWPGNVRELRNIVERLTILYPGRRIGLSQLPPEFCGYGEGEKAGGIRDKIARTELEVITSALAQAGGRKGIAAEQLGISRHALKRRMQRLGME